jgi:hypothetical protein
VTRWWYLCQPTTYHRPPIPPTSHKDSLVVFYACHCPQPLTPLPTSPNDSLVVFLLANHPPSPTGTTNGSSRLVGGFLRLPPPPTSPSDSLVVFLSANHLLSQTHTTNESRRLVGGFLCLPLPSTTDHHRQRVTMTRWWFFRLPATYHRPPIPPTSQEDCLVVFFACHR